MNLLRWMSALALVFLLVVGLAISHVDVLGVATFDGEIADESPAAMRAQVDAINENPRIKAVLLEMNSPGGGVYASAELRDEIARIKVPVVAYCRYWCASGGYYAITSPSVREIVVGRGTLIGSIGVIRVVRRQDVPPGYEIYKSGKFKQAGNVSPAAPGEKEYLQSDVDLMAATFYDAVSLARGDRINKESWVHVKNAEVFDGPGGVRIGLADAVVSRDAAVEIARTLAPRPERTFTFEELTEHPLRSLFRAITH